MKKRTFLKHRKIVALALAAVLTVTSVSGYTGREVMESKAESTVDLTNGLIVHYTFDDTLSNEAGAVGAAATMQVGSEAYTEGIKGKAFDFSANSGTSMLSGAGCAVKLDTLPTTTTFSLNYWVKGSGSAFHEVMFDGGCQYFVFGEEGGSQKARASQSNDFTWDGTQFDRTISSTGTFDATEWRMVTYTVSSTGQVQLYINGVKQSTSSTDATTAETDGCFAYEKDSVWTNMFSDDAASRADVGYLGSGNWWSPNFAGAMDEFRMYNRVLNEDEIKTLAVTGIGFTPKSGVTLTDGGVYQLTTDMITAEDGSVELSDLFSAAFWQNVKGSSMKSLTLSSLTVTGDDVSQNKIEGLSDEEVHTVTVSDGTYSSKIKIQALNKVNCTALAVYDESDTSVSALTLPKKGVSIEVEATGSENSPTTDEISVTATGCTVAKGSTSTSGNKTTVGYTVIPTADTGSLVFTCGSKTVTVTTAKLTNKFSESGLIDLDFESADTAGDEKYTEDGATYTLTGSTEVVTNPDDPSDKVLKTTTTGYLESASAVLAGKDFTNGVSFTTRIRPETQASDWDYVFSLGNIGKSYVDGTIGFIMRAGAPGADGSPYIAYFPESGWAAGNNVNSDYAWFKTAANCGKWQTLTYTYDEEKFCMYVDGVLTISQDVSGDASKISDVLKLLSAEGNFSLGCGIDRSLEKTPAYYDDVKVFNRVLSADEAAYLAALNDAKHYTTAAYEDNAAKTAVSSAITTAKAAVKENDELNTTTLAAMQTQTTNLKNAVTNNQSNLTIKTFSMARTAENGFTYDVENGVDLDAVTYGSDIAFVLKPNAGYTIKGVKIDNEPVSADVNDRYTIDNVKETHTIAVDVEKNSYIISKYVDGKKTDWTVSVDDADGNGDISFPALTSAIGWFLNNADSRNASDAVDKISMQNLSAAGKASIYAYNEHSVNVTATTTGLDGGEVKTYPSNTDVYYMGQTVMITVTPETGKTVEAVIKDGQGDVVDYWVEAASGSNQNLVFEMPASNVEVTSISFAGVSMTKLDALLQTEKTLYDSDNATSTEGLSKKYTTASWSAYKTAYEAAKAVSDAGTDGKEQYEIDAAANNLKTAKAALVYFCAVTLPASLNMEKGEIHDALTATVVTDGTDTTVSWSSDDPSIVTVDAKTGELRAKASGSVTITATAPDGSTAESTVNVAVTATAIRLKDFQMVDGATYKASVIATPTGASTGTVTWTSDDDSIARVNEKTGVVTAKSVGTTTIRATANGLNASCTVEVINEVDCTAGFKTANSPGVEIGDDGAYMTFKTKSTGTNQWDAPIVCVYSGDTPNLSQFYSIRSDMYALWPTGGTTDLTVENLSTETPDWSAMATEFQAGVDCYVSAQLVGSYVKVRMFIGKVSQQAMIPVTGDGPFYLTISGEKCDNTDMKVVSKANYTEPAPYAPSYPYYPDSNPTPKPAITPGPVVDVPIQPSDIVKDQTITGTAWWTGNTLSNNYVMNGTDTSMVLYVGATALDSGGYGAFNIELVSGGKYLTTGSDKNAWYAEGASGGTLYAPNSGSVLEKDHVYRITITRSGNNITINYYDATSQEEYYEVTAEGINFGKEVQVHLIAQVGTFVLGQEVTVEDDGAKDDDTSKGEEPDTTPAPSEVPDTTPAPSEEPDATPAPSEEPDATPAPTTEPESTPGVKPGTNVEISGNAYKVDNGSKVTYKQNTKKKATKAVVPNTVTIKGKKYKVTTVAKNAFKNNKKLKKVQIGKNVTSIGRDAFKNCKNLKTIVIRSTNLKKAGIAKNAFRGISSGTVIKVPKKKVNAYKALFRKKGLDKAIKVKAI